MTMRLSVFPLLSLALRITLPPLLSLSLSLVSYSRTLTITNFARVSRLSPAKTNSANEIATVFLRRASNLMTTICTAIYLGIATDAAPPTTRKKGKRIWSY